MFCRNCGQPMNDNQEICLNCGVKKLEGNQFCYNCGNAVPPIAEVCVNCGVSLKVKSASADELGGYSKTTLALICFFLGGFGVHNFMLGETKKGIFKIVATCCFFLGGIFALIDFIKILTDKYVIDPNKLI